MQFVSTLRQRASHLWSIDIAALDAEKTALACQARTAVFDVAYARGLAYTDIALAFGWYDRRRKFSRSDVTHRHLTMLKAPGYRERHRDLLALVKTYPVVYTVPGIAGWRVNA